MIINILMIIHCILVLIGSIFIVGDNTTKAFVKYALILFTVIAIMYWLTMIGIDVFSYFSKLLELLSQKIKEGGK